MTPTPMPRPGRFLPVLLGLALVAFGVPAFGQQPQTTVRSPLGGLFPTQGKAKAKGQVKSQPTPAEAPGRQVTLFGVIATPGNAGVDPRLAKVAPQLRKLLPNHGFQLLDVQSKRLVVGQSLACDLGDGFTAATTLIHPFDDNGKVELRCAVLSNQMVQYETLVSTPPNQLFYCEKSLVNGQRLLIGVGAR